jgi:protein-tyrosine phosphatase
VDSEPEIEYRRYAVPDLGIPPRPGMVKILDEIDALLAAGRRVYVHCWGGTGTVVGCYLVRHGKSADEALALIAEWR